MQTARLLTIEDDPDISHLLHLDLCEAGFEVEQADAGLSGLRMARERGFDLIILDLGLPDFDGAEIARRLRRTSSVPIIALTARDAVETKVHLLTLGADDYLVKPFHSEELVARIRVQLRVQGSRPALRAGVLTVQPSQRLAFYRDQPLELIATEFDLLTCLMQPPGKVFTCRELHQAVWQVQLPPDSGVIDMHMANVRAKLLQQGGVGLIRTVRGIGYALRD